MVVGGTEDTGGGRGGYRRVGGEDSGGEGDLARREVSGRMGGGELVTAVGRGGNILVSEL